jgi:phosphopantothenoylcysteine synthetase/decarboxylase
VNEPVLYVVASGCPASTDLVPFVKELIEDGWRTCVITTPMGARFVPCFELEQLTEFPVRSEYKMPDEPDVLPPADAIAAAPATFNTVNKIAQGITDTLASGLVCEGIGAGIPVVVAPSLNPALSRHGAFRRSLGQLADDGVRLVLSAALNLEPRAIVSASDDFPWQAVRRVLRDSRLTARMIGCRPTRGSRDPGPVRAGVP